MRGREREWRQVERLLRTLRQGGRVDGEFAELICADDQWLREAFDALIAASYGPPPWSSPTASTCEAAWPEGPAYRWHLVDTTARSNRQKADQDPASWLPPYEAARCRYAAEWTAVKLRWELSVDPAEREAPTDLGRSCPDQRLPTSAANQR